MSNRLRELIVARIRERGPITVAEYIDLALYHREHGYYATAPRRSGRSGDFFTSVDAGPLFGELIAAQVAELWPVLHAAGAAQFDLVEAGAGDGRLARDILDAAARGFPDLYRALRVTLVDRSTAAGAAQPRQLAGHADRVTSTCCQLPRSITGAIVANELLDAMPVHRVVVRDGAIREVHVADSQGALVEVELPPSTPRIEEYLTRTRAALPEGVFAEVGLAAVEWMAEVSAAIDRGVVLLFDYGFEAGQLYSSMHASGTLMAYRRHLGDAEHWLAAPGATDLTSHVNLTAIRIAALDGGLTPLGVIDQTYFLTSLGIAERLDNGQSVESIRRRLAARTLLMPGGLGSTVKVMAFGKNVWTLALRGFSTGRLT